MAINQVPGHGPSTFTVEPNDVFSVLPQGGTIYTDAALTVEGRIVESDPFLPVNANGAVSYTHLTLPTTSRV